MCARFTLRRVDALGDRFRATLALDADLAPRSNVAPATDIPIVVAGDDGRRVRLARWGLIPGWAKDAAIGRRLINARGETLAEKPSFRTALAARRRLIPLDGFYEWAVVAEPSGAPRKRPTFIHRRDDGLLAAAGLYERWRGPDGRVIATCALITTRPNDLLAPIHDRMPALLRPEAEEAWLAPALAPDWPALLEPYPDAWLEAYAVSPAVNRPGHEDPALAPPLVGRVA
jgi:putative SOS response-associated peptidase YedK